MDRWMVEVVVMFHVSGFFSCLPKSTMATIVPFYLFISNCLDARDHLIKKDPSPCDPPVVICSVFTLESSFFIILVFTFSIKLCALLFFSVLKLKSNH